jgi:hydrogenase nickel incorporation protein HypA/HybF
MHELSITENMLDIVLEQAKQAGAKKVSAINLVIGELSGYAEESVRFYFDLMSRNTPAQGATLNFKSSPAQGRCRKCAQDFSLAQPDWTCPKCGANDLEITSGKELFVESIEVE